MRDDHYYPKGAAKKADWGTLPAPVPGTSIASVLDAYTSRIASPKVSATFSNFPLDIGLLMQDFPAIDAEHPEAADACVDKGHYFAGLVLEFAPQD